MKGQLLYYGSRLDERLQPLPVCATGGAGQKALILDLSPGAISDLGGSVKRCEQLATWAQEGGVECVVAKPCGRGPGTVYQGPAEVDLFEAVDALGQTFAIDPDRVSLIGGSMGGAATWYIASHYPDRFAAAAPFCGYCDYRLWTKPGGDILRMHPWEEFSWRSRDAAFRVENLSHTALWITHGEWDIGIGGGVPVEHSRRMSRALTKLGIAHHHTEVPRCGHGCMTEENIRPVLAWLGQQRRVAHPDHVRLIVHGLRHHASHWVSVDQMERYGDAARVDAKFESRLRLVVATENVRRLSLGPCARKTPVDVVLDGFEFQNVLLWRRVVAFEQEGKEWRYATAGVPAVQKRPGASGPIGDAFFGPVRLVPGTTGSGHENFLIDWMAGAIPGYFKQKNGGVNRGIFDGETQHEIPVVSDRQLADAALGQCHLFLLGTYDSNQILARFRGQLPLEFGSRSIRIGERVYQGENLGVCACFPSPANPDRLVVVTGGVSPTAITGATHFNLQLLPDYLVWDGDQMLDFGFFGNDWR